MWSRSSLRLAVLAAALVSPAALSATAPATTDHATAAAYPVCFGAASRDPAHPCHNPALAHVVIPTIDEARITPNAPCIPTDPALNVCRFGVPRSRALAQVALVGDSHAEHWRAAVAYVAAHLGWEGISVTRSSCPLSLTPSALPPPRDRECDTWVRAARAWFSRHPAIHTMLLAGHSRPVRTRPGQSALEVQVTGYEQMLTSLPASVTRVFVLRDNPYIRGATLWCIRFAMAGGAQPGPACARPRAGSLVPDPAAIAATRLASPRYAVVDLTRAFCDARRCYPVIGGALVYKDSTHMTRVFAATLGPQLLDALTAAPPA